jgi:hypothetical protein
MAPRGNKGYFHGEPLSFLNDSLPHYLSIAPIKKEIFWSKFFPEWDTKYPKLDSEELKEELEEEERLHKEETERVKVANQEEAKRRGRRKAVLQAYPATGARLNELRARAADQTVREPFSFFFFFGRMKDMRLLEIERVVFKCED